MNHDDSINTPHRFDEMEHLVGAAANKLHLTGSEELTCELAALISLETTEDYAVNDGVVNFLSIEGRNRVVASYRFREHKMAFQNEPSKWFAVATELWRQEIGRKDTAAGRLLARINETNEIFDLCSESIVKNSENVFIVLGTLQSAFPYLQSFSAEGIWKVSIAQYEMTKNDMAGGVFFDELKRALATQPDVCRTIHLRLRDEITESTAQLYHSSMMALANSSAEEVVRLTLEDTRSFNGFLRSVALWTLGQMILASKVDHGLMVLARNAVFENLSSSKANVRQTAMRVAAIASAVSDDFVEELQRIATGNDSFAIAAIVEAIWRHFDLMKSRSFFHDWIRIGCQTPANFTGTLPQLDHILSKLISDASEQQLTLSCLTRWVEVNGTDTPRNEAFPQIFPLFTLRLMERPHLFSQLFTDWLLAEGMRLPAAAAGLLAYATLHKFSDPEFDTAKLDALDESDFLFLARRLVGFIYAEENLISLALSLFKTRELGSRMFPILRSLLVDEIGYDYPHSTIEALESLQSNATDSELKSFLSSAIQNIKNRMTNIESLPRLTELQPATELKRRLSRAYAKQMTTVMDGAQENSLIRQLAKTIPIRGGKGYFSFQDGLYSEPAYLKPFSHSITLPQRLVLDTVGHEMSLLMLRNTKRGER